MSNRIQIRRGLERNLPTLAVGELGLSVDTRSIWVGTYQGNILIVKDAQKFADELNAFKDEANVILADIVSIREDLNEQDFRKLVTDAADIFTEMDRVKSESADAMALATDVEERFNLVIQASGDNVPEVMDARMGEQTLRAYNQKVAGQLAETAKEADLLVERQRINNLATLSEGSTTGDAELIDMRVGADGVIYDSAGDATRAVGTKANDAISEIEKLTNPIEQKLSYAVEGGITLKKLFEPNGDYDTPQGVNKLKFPFNKTVINDINFNVEIDGCITLKGTPSGSFNFIDIDIFEIGQTYTLRYEHISGAVSFVTFNGIDNIGNNTSESRTITFTATATNLRARISGGVPQDGKFRMQIEKAEAFSYWNPPIYMPFVFSSQSAMQATHQLYLDAKNNISRPEFIPYLATFDGGQITYNNSQTGLEAGTVQEAIDLMLTSDENDGKEVVLPARIPVVYGREMNIYFNNILKGDRHTSAHKIRTTNIHDTVLFNDHISWTPTEGNYEWTLNPDKSFDFFVYYHMKNNETEDITGKTTLIPVPANAGSGVSKKVMLIGDSLTASGVYATELKNLFNADVMDIELIGTRGKTENPHEGRSAWAALEYCTVPSFNGAENAFWNPATSKFDFTHYMNTNAFAGVDYVFINLGINDLAKTGSNSVSQIIGYYNQMITSIKAYNPTIKIFIGLPTVRGLQGDVDKHTNSVLNLIKGLKMEFDDRESEGFYTVPNYINVDPMYDFPSKEITISARNPKTITRITDPIHPNDYGYYKMADVIFSYLKYVQTL